MIIIKHKGNFKNTDGFFGSVRKMQYEHILHKYGRQGVLALSSATPVDTGLTANSWSYEVESSNGSFTISWKNSNVVNGVPIAIIIQYGHATKNGGYVEGTDYINPALKPIFDNMVNELWREVSNT